jgi:hypothetical protein
MSPDATNPIPPPASKGPEAKLIRNIEALCVRIVRGKAAVQNASVWWQRILGIASIVFSSLGSVGVIADKAAGNLQDQSGWAFWGSVILLGFGIASQIANQFRVGQLAADSESLAVRCGLYGTRLTDMLMDEDPQSAVADLFVEVTTLFQSERYNVVLPPEIFHRDCVQGGIFRDPVESRFKVQAKLPSQSPALLFVVIRGGFGFRFGPGMENDCFHG